MILDDKEPNPGDLVVFQPIEHYTNRTLLITAYRVDSLYDLSQELDRLVGLHATNTMGVKNSVVVYLGDRQTSKDKFSYFLHPDRGILVVRLKPEFKLVRVIEA